MRDIAMFAVVLGLLPLVFSRPWLGVLLWTWIGIMSPHRLAWSYAVDFPFALTVGLVTLISLITSREKKVFPLTPEIVVLLLFIFWITFGTLFALYPELAWDSLKKALKIQLFILITLMVMHERRHIELLIWVSTLSVAFYGVKGGIYTLLGGGGGMVLGPVGSFIEGNTTIALAIVIAIPLIRFLQLRSERRWMRWALGLSMILCALAVVGTYSRGALLAVGAMGFFMWLKSRQKVATGLVLLSLALAILYFMPEAWHQRMTTIQTYQEDGSAMGRINAWQFAYNLALDHPLVGGGFETFQKEAFERWAPNPLDLHDAHSIWFEVLGEHGFVGLSLYLLLWFFSWRSASAIIKLTQGKSEFDWANELARLIQVAYVGFFVGGSFLGLAYWDYPYILLVVLVLTRRLVQIELSSVAASRRLTSPTALPGVANVQVTPQP